MRAVPGQRPRPLGDPRVHLMRVRRMAKAVGADPAAAQNAGLLEHDDWVAMVERCRTCEIPAACDRWLDGITLREADEQTPGRSSMRIVVIGAGAVSKPAV